MNYKKGKKFESAVEMFEWLHNGNYILTSSGQELGIGNFGAFSISENFKIFHQAIEEKEDEVREFFRWDYCFNNQWETTLLFYNDEFKTSKGDLHHYMSKLPDSKKRKIESSKIRINMRTLEVVDG